jgi:PPOX class probable F420-dependent enzyme
MFTSRTRLHTMLVGCCALVLGLWLVPVLAKSKAPDRPPLPQDKINTFLAGKRNAILATIKHDGSPQLTPVIYRWDGEQFWVSTTKDRAKYKNIRRDPRVSLCIDDADTSTTVIASGTARITEDNLWVDTRKIVERYRGPEPATAYVQSMQEKKEPRVLLVLKPEKVISWGG